MTHAPHGPSAHVFTPDQRVRVFVSAGACTTHLGADDVVRRAVRLFAALVLATGLLQATLAAAQETPSTIRASMAQGRYEAAFHAAGAVTGVEGLLLRAEAANLYAHYAAESEEERRAWSERAAGAAREAIDLAPAVAQAPFELGRAEGTMAASSGIAQNLNRAGELRDLFERTLELDPDHPGARMALAQWHLELSERGVAWLFGGRGDRVLPLARSAVEVAPERIDLRVELASVLRRLGRVEEAEAHLREALARDPTSHADRLEQARAERLLSEPAP